jgi:hypothetical protein
MRVLQSHPESLGKDFFPASGPTYVLDVFPCRLRLGDEAGWKSKSKKTSEGAGRKERTRNHASANVSVLRSRGIGIDRPTHQIAKAKATAKAACAEAGAVLRPVTHMDPATVHARVSVTCSNQERYNRKTPQVRLRFMFHYYHPPSGLATRENLPRPGAGESAA